MSDACVKEFVRHSTDLLKNLHELRSRNLMTDVTLLVGGAQLRAHGAVLIACSGFFYSRLSRRVGGVSGGRGLSLSLPEELDVGCVSLLLDFMYTSRLPLSTHTAPALLHAATYLQMEHVADACRAFLSVSVMASGSPPGGRSPPAQPSVFSPFRPPSEAEDPALDQARVPGEDSTPSPSTPDTPCQSSGQPDTPTEGSGCGPAPPSPKPCEAPDPKACNWKKYKYIVLNPAIKEEGSEEGPDPQRHSHFVCDAMKLSPMSQNHLPVTESPEVSDRPLVWECPLSSAPPPAPPSVLHHHHHHPSKAGAHPSHREPIRSEKPSGGRGCCGEKPYRCQVCGAQFNRPANLKTHTRIHSGEKPYTCDTCGARFVQVAHLRAHVLIHTGEKPYPCDTCGTRFRHLQTLKSHLRIHTGEKPYSCEQCRLRFRHKSQLRLHLRQKHGAVTNTKIRYRVLPEPFTFIHS